MTLENLLNKSLKELANHNVIVLVEDDPATRDVMERLLQLRNFEVHTAETIEAGRALALDLAKKPKGVFAVLSDGHLPDGDGFQLRDLKEKEGFENTKFLFLTGDTFVDGPDIMHKPIDQSSLAAHLRAWLIEKELKAQNEYVPEDMLRVVTEGLSEAERTQIETRTLEKLHMLLEEAEIMAGPRKGANNSEHYEMEDTSHVRELQKRQGYRTRVQEIKALIEQHGEKNPGIRTSKDQGGHAL